MVLKKYKHCVVGSSYHLQFTPKYRRDVFESAVVLDSCKRVFYDIANRLGVDLEAVEFGPEHVHLFVTGCKKYSVEKLAHRFKGASSFFIRKNCWNSIKAKLWGQSFWSDGYFAESVGRVTAESIKFYIERQQDKHWEHKDYEEVIFERDDLVNGQTKIQDFMF